MPTSNSQVENTPALIYSIDSGRTLKWKSRRISESLQGMIIWIDNKDNTQMFSLNSETVTIINPHTT